MCKTKNGIATIFFFFFHFFLYATKFLQNIPYGYLHAVMACTKTFTPNGRTESRTTPLHNYVFTYATHRLNLIHIAINFHQDILYGYLVTARTKIV